MISKKRSYSSKDLDYIYSKLIQAAEAAGGEEGLDNYLKTQAINNPQLFFNLLGKVLSLRVPENNYESVCITQIEITAPKEKSKS